MNTQVVVINGASAGVGRAVAREFARKGCRLGLIARDADRLEAACGEVKALGGEAIPLTGDCSDAAFLDAAAEEVQERFGPIDVWVNNAMVTVLAPVDQIKPDEFRRVTEVTYLGTVYGTLAALARMKPRNRGTIVQVGSALAYRAIPLQSAYCGAKHAIRGFTDSLRSELLHEKSNIHVTMVQLPAINTPQFGWCLSRLPKHPQPVPPIYQPEVAARSIVWAAEHRRREVWLGRSAIISITGNKLLPWLGDRYLAGNGYDSQQTNEPVDANRPDNLYQTVPGSQAAHGKFNARAKTRAVQLATGWRSTVGMVACSAAVAALAGALCVAARDTVRATGAS